MPSHFLAFGNSDQESFRNLEVQDSFDVMTVPGTIASYYSEATAAFVLSSQLDYLIDPRTPLFQEDVAVPRASHLSLATWHGEAVRDALDAGIGFIDPTFYTVAVVDEMVRSIVERQRTYAGNASAVRKKLDRYAALLAEAMAEQGAAAPTTETRSPVYVLAPYFAVKAGTDPWQEVQDSILRAAVAQDAPETISAVICVDGRQRVGPSILREKLRAHPAELSRTVFVWITDFDERVVGRAQLAEFWRVIEEFSSDLQIVNMYGSYFSICAQHAGLAGFGNGLTYSESRSWPALASTGAAPPRYYVPRLHGFLPLAVAATLIDQDDYFRCHCSACSAWEAAGGSIASLPYHDLKRHFAIARREELDFVSANTPAGIVDQLREASLRFETVRRRPALAGVRGMAYLDEWSAAIEEVAPRP